MTGSSAVPEYGVVVLDCPEPRKLADFYAALLEWPEPEGDEGGEWVTITGPQGAKIAFQGVEGYQAPEWPGQDLPQQLHLDFYVGDLDVGGRRAVELGAKPLDGSAKEFRVFADPAGHPFCLCRS